MTHTEEHTTTADDGAKHAFSSDIESLKKSLAQLRTDVTSLLGTALNVGKTGAHVAKEQGAAAVDGVKHKIHDLKDKGAETAEAFEHKISDNPLTSVILAFGIGFILARIFSRK
jgi:ElaB/YqjD/DUF883 family membrane-anchored ribosome-binding protein